MKIISKYKDYYDYLSGIYGEDPLLVLDRRTDSEIIKIKDLKLNGIDIFEYYILYIGKYAIRFLINKNGIYFTKEQFEKKQENIDMAIEQFRYSAYLKLKDNFLDQYFYSKRFVIKEIKGKLLTIEENCPIILVKLNKFDRCIKLIKYPILQGSGIESILPPEEIYKILCDHLSQVNQMKEKPVPVGDDKTRILSAGFDLKSSFRPKRKKK